MAWYRNIETGVIFDISSEDTLEHVQKSPIFEAIDPPRGVSTQENTGTKEDTKEPAGDNALDSMTKKELKELATNMGIEISNRMNVKELKSAILNAE